MSDSDCDNSPKALEGLLRKRASQKGVLTKHFNYFRDTDGAELDRQCLSIKEERLRATFDRFEKLNLEICALNPDADDCDAVETKYLETLTLIKRLMQKLDDNQVVSPPPLQTMATKLPEINVPIFVGKYSEYKPFIELFNALVDRNSSLQDVQKLFYLRSFLKDEPFDLIKNLPLQSESYTEAKTLLKDRYDNEYKITNEHINILLDLNPITKSTAGNIRVFVSCVKQQLASLKNLKHDIKSWDSILLCILTRKLDAYCNREFQLIKDNKPSVSTLIDFLERRALALENAERTQVQFPVSKAAHTVTVKDVAGATVKSAPPPLACTLCAVAV
ncbi:uncharacterized protein LOC126381480 isoform X2 [Pectinophora gossypiella]|uniref:uncharacterized protein LOC126381480 isoform X2 n=1 Tax=Pectinophora gossypiella TaxID=13191 RepID=UPI00214E26B4|nr:uncharacterized protein LOC126381480 isoform X2 [Pectinophora gossypiella]